MRNSRDNRMDPRRRMGQLAAEAEALDRAKRILSREFGVDVRDVRELGYALRRGPRELRRELLELQKKAG